MMGLVELQSTSHSLLIKHECNYKIICHSHDHTIIQISLYFFFLSTCKGALVDHENKTIMIINNNDSITLISYNNGKYLHIPNKNHHHIIYIYKYIIFFFFQKQIQ